MLDSIYALDEKDRIDILHKYSKEESLQDLSLEYDVSIEGLTRDLEYEFSEGQARKQIEGDIKLLNKMIKSMSDNALLGCYHSASVLSKLIDQRQELIAAKATLKSYYERDLVRLALSLRN